MLDLGQVRSFVAIVDNGGFQAAARQLGLAQPTVSQHLRKLEDALGVALVVRSNAQCRPTPKGALFLSHARRMLETERHAIASVHDGRLTIAAASNIGVYFLPAQVRSYLQWSGDAAPVGFLIGDNRSTLDALRTGRCDLALMEWWPDGETGFEAVEWCRERLVMIVPPGHRWAGRSIRVQDLTQASSLGEEFVLGGEPGTGTGRILRSALEAVGCTALDISADLGSTEAVKQAVSAGLGISIVLQSTVVAEIEAGSLAICELHGTLLEKPLYCALPVATPENSRARKLQRMLMQECGKRHVPVTSRDYVSHEPRQFDRCTEWADHDRRREA